MNDGGGAVLLSRLATVSQKRVQPHPHSRDEADEMF